ncbi:MAG: 3-deoxy-D-manno-octulosonic acid transferase, partial [Chitinophagales bacterium]
MKSLDKRFRSSLLLYNLVLMVYQILIRIAATFNPKAKKWVAGRKNLLQKVKTDFGELKRVENGEKRKTVWLHAASLGEFEQGRPIMEGIKKQHPNCILVLTFFSPSGYEIRKNYAVADYVYYLPLDSRRNAQQFVEVLQPDLVVFVKYEFWYYYFEALKERNIPIFIVSAIFRPKQHFFKWYGSLFRALLQYCEHIFVQNEESLQLLQNIGIGQVSIAGDTRLDRVFDNSESAESIPVIEAFKSSNTLWVAGSTWSKDEEILAQFLTSVENEHRDTETRRNFEGKYRDLAGARNERRDGETERGIEDRSGEKSVNRQSSTVHRFVIAPHEIHEKHLLQIEKLLTVKSIRFSHCREGTDFEGENIQVLIVDNIGLLSSMYQYADYVFIGGGFGAGIHNVLEAAVFGMPIFFGPNHGKFQEAVDLIDRRGAYSVEGVKDLILKVKELERSEALYREASRANRNYVLKNKGGSEEILKVV